MIPTHCDSSETVSLLLTVKNEATNISLLLDSIANQSRLPDELIITDGGSVDGTYEALIRFKEEQANQEEGIFVVVEQLTGSNISEGRNAAIALSSGNILAITDAGVMLPFDWLEKIITPLICDQELAVVSGFFHATPQNAFEAALGVVTLPLAHEIDPHHFLPSSRSIALRRSAMEAVGGYPEWLDYCEDLILDLRLRSNGAKFHFLPGASVGFRPRTSLSKYGLQYFRYARGDGKADLWRLRHAMRYLVYLWVTPLLMVFGIYIHPAFFLLLLIGAFVYIGPLYRRLPLILRRVPRLNLHDRLIAWLWVGPLRIFGDLAKILGYPVGWIWRMRNRPPHWR